MNQSALRRFMVFFGGYGGLVGFLNFFPHADLSKRQNIEEDMLNVEIRKYLHVILGNAT
jgi:hypothetical protein